MKMYDANDVLACKGDRFSVDKIDALFAEDSNKMD
jgi:hypothetical protein